LGGDPSGRFGNNGKERNRTVNAGGRGPRGEGKTGRIGEHSQCEKFKVGSE